ncbi:MAG: LURP-one-related family protein [Clostridia bacterium]|nr:LURP-one-related family protein [Clostridia bacterium]
MKMLFKQRFFSWFDSYDIYDEAGNTLFTVEGKFAWGHKLHILDNTGEHIGTVQQQVFTLLPKFDLYEGDRQVGVITKEFSFLRPRYTLDCRGWDIEGDWMGWDYQIVDSTGTPVAYAGKQLFNWTDTYVIDVAFPSDALHALMVVLAIDAANCDE